MNFKINYILDNIIMIQITFILFVSDFIVDSLLVVYASLSTAYIMAGMGLRSNLYQNHS